MINKYKTNKPLIFYENKKATFSAWLFLLNNFKDMTVGVICILICLPIWPCILNIYQPTNESRTQHTIYLTTEYFIDPDRYYYLIMLHMEVSGSIAAITIVGIGMTLTAFLAHACGMFRIARWMKNKTLHKNMSPNIYCDFNQNTLNCNLINIYRHRK